jgi:hypothetical protein
MSFYDGPLHASAPTGHTQGGHLRRNATVTNSVKDVHIWR